MSDLNKPIRPISREDRDRLKVQKIESYKQEELESAPSFKTKDEQKIKKILSSFFLFAFKKIFNHFIPEKVGVKSLLSPDKVLHDIRLILKLLIVIRDEDPANDPKFAFNFSSAWHNLLEHYLYHTKTKEPTMVNLEKVNSFLQSAHHFPQNEEHNLAFYLQKYSEEEWFPVPFFKLISRLHDEYFSKGSYSELDMWIRLLHEILAEAKTTNQT